jgi:hypothetical protein
VADDAVARIGTLIEQLGARFELVVEAVSGWGGRLESLREEMRAQFAEVGKQVRFISEQIALNRQAVVNVKADLAAEIVRLGEALGHSRVEFRDRLAALESDFKREIALRGEQTRTAITEDIGAARAILEHETKSLHAGLSKDLTANAAKLKSDLANSAEALIKKFEGELKRATKALATLDRKFDRFDDRITIQTRDQEQRVRKLERGSQR